MENNLTHLEGVKTTLEYQLHIAEQHISDLKGELKEKDQQIREKESKLIELGKQVADKIVLEEMLEEEKREVFKLKENIKEIRQENTEKMISEELLHVTDHQLRERQEEPANWQRNEKQLVADIPLNEAVTAPHLRLREKNLHHLNWKNNAREQHRNLAEKINHKPTVRRKSRQASGATRGRERRRKDYTRVK